MKQEDCNEESVFAENHRKGVVWICLNVIIFSTQEQTFMEIIVGKVEKGFGIGRKLGFPTINIAHAPKAFGVFAAEVRIAGEKYMGALHMGPRPTFDCTGPSVEVYLLDAPDDFEMESDEIELRLLEKVREVMKFDSVDDLKAQIARDLEKIREILT